MHFGVPSADSYTVIPLTTAASPPPPQVASIIISKPVIQGAPAQQPCHGSAAACLEFLHDLLIVLLSAAPCVYHIHCIANRMI